MDYDLNNKKELVVSQVHNYGTCRVYPMCNTSKTLARIAGATTLTGNNIKLIKQLGYTFRVVSEGI